MKTKQKIALYLISTNVALLLIFGASIYYFLYTYSYNDFYKRLQARASISSQYNLSSDNLNAESLKAVREEHLEKLLDEKEYIIALTEDPASEQAAIDHGLPASLIQEIKSTGSGKLQIDDTFYAGRLDTYEQKQYIVAISARNYYASNHLLFLRNSILIAIVLIIIINVYLSFYFSKHFFDPVKKITEKVKEISSENIYQRIEERVDDNEISQLISTFNNLLNRLETAFETQRGFISNASHEFGTPLTFIMGEAEVTLKKERTPEEYQKSLKSILSQAERLNQITQSLLFLAQTGYKNKSIHFEILRSDEMIWQAKEIVDTLHPRNQLLIDFNLLPENPIKLKIKGSRQLISLALVNVMSNACKYGNHKSSFVSLASSDNHVIIIVKDQGIGIPNTELQFVYDPFFRASNTHSYEGYGIGLPLTRNILRMHNGTIHVFSQENEGTTVEIKIPLAFIES